MRADWEKLDPSGMGEAIRNCHGQILESLAEGEWVPANPRSFNKVLYLGMGGSAIGGEMVRVWSEKMTSIPMTVVRDYRAPRWVDDQTLVIASSYSGETEETLSATADAASKGAQIAVLASGGRLSEMANSNGWSLLTIPGGFQPRAAIGYGLTAICRVLVAYQMFPGSILEDLSQGAELMGREALRWADAESDGNLALQTAELLADGLPIIYGVAGTTEALAVRFRGQLAENSNIFASHHLLPELNHNEIVGLNDRLASDGHAIVIWLTDKEDHERVTLRQELTAELTGLRSDSGAASSPRDVTLSGKGPTLVQRNLTLLNLLDWVSYYAALIRGVDPTAIEVLLRLKKRLSSGR